MHHSHAASLLGREPIPPLSIRRPRLEAPWLEGDGNHSETHDIRHTNGCAEPLRSEGLHGWLATTHLGQVSGRDQGPNFYRNAPRMMRDALELSDVGPLCQGPFTHDGAR